MTGIWQNNTHARTEAEREDRQREAVRRLAKLFRNYDSPAFARPMTPKDMYLEIEREYGRVL